jgi:hypothetical protein
MGIPAGGTKTPKVGIFVGGFFGGDKLEVEMREQAGWAIVESKDGKTSGSLWLIQPSQ